MTRFFLGGTPPRKGPRPTGSRHDRGAEVGFQITHELVELARAGTRRGEHQIAPALREHRAQALTGLTNPFYEHDVLGAHQHAALHELHGVALLRRPFVGFWGGASHVSTRYPQTDSRRQQPVGRREYDETFFG
jgi:hypothetical protein